MNSHSISDHDYCPTSGSASCHQQRQQQWMDLTTPTSSHHSTVIIGSHIGEQTPLIQFNAGTVCYTGSTQSVRTPLIRYSLKSINYKKKSEYSVHTLSFQGHFQSLRHLKAVFHNELSSEYESVDNQVGYILPGHGAKGRQMWLNNDSDVANMYKECEDKREIMIWCYKGYEKEQDQQPPSKRPCRKEESTSDKAELLVKKISEVDEIVSALTEKHGQSGSFSVEQLRAWAHMLQLKKHHSYEEPPDKPFFKKKQIAKESKGNNASPKKNRIELRSQCMEQLQKWHDLLAKNVITQQQYDELHAKIMTDITQL